MEGSGRSCNAIIKKVTCFRQQCMCRYRQKVFIGWAEPSTKETFWGWKTMIIEEIVPGRAQWETRKKSTWRAWYEVEQLHMKWCIARCIGSIRKVMFWEGGKRRSCGASRDNRFNETGIEDEIMFWTKKGSNKAEKIGQSAETSEVKCRIEPTTQTDKTMLNSTSHWDCYSKAF